MPGVADARIQQSHSNPGFNIDVDRTRAQYVGVTERDVTNSLVVDLAGSDQVQPTYWLNPENGVNYSIVMQTPQYQIDSLNALQNLPITGSGGPPQVLGAIETHAVLGGAPMTPTLRALAFATRDALAADLGESRFDELRAAGAASAVEDVVHRTHNALLAPPSAE